MNITGVVKIYYNMFMVSSEKTFSCDAPYCIYNLLFINSQNWQLWKVRCKMTRNVELLVAGSLCGFCTNFCELLFSTVVVGMYIVNVKKYQGTIFSAVQRKANMTQKCTQLNWLTAITHIYNFRMKFLIAT